MGNMSCCESREDRINRKVLEIAQELGLNAEEYKDVFTEISDRYNDELIRGLSKLCKTPQDYKRASDMLLPHFKKIYSRADGSADYVGALIREIEAGRITTLDQLADVSEKLGQMNEAYWEINGNGAKRRNGGQFYDYIRAIVLRPEIGRVLDGK